MMILALTGGQLLIFAIVIWVAVMWLILECFGLTKREPPMPPETRRLKKELERYEDEED